ncbi:PREDICTED: DEAD-box helicase Dbp80 isoform X1 [Trachymyrmex septentrionalis]|uniref:DEAD-box helicase Dbp80 isoform X1 n=1 Tax=Trachymyrmex septentrionalis TaxID=34720 RepID=UPI00084EEEAF|nr:PREDICTED: DEAD-box helicase Dbp80 isoform X1 [Trachymyrmex septentrionalis]XP_018353614.1 PREDICTED: DEAD-box helicase Dbp80 isoform X1 [Trachymyrmex septentrionalis]XP_018353615.1 PREDICTED: DEAD-box helicase Dbp80 isoform X1 [Trachymyrmex septentrionalis]
MASTKVDWGQCADEQDKLASKVTSLNLDKPNSTSIPTPTVKDGDSKSDDDTSEEQISPAEKSLLQKIIRKGLVETTKAIEIQRQDPNSPLHSIKTFEALHLKPALLRGVYALGFNAPSRIQETALPTLLADPPQNMIAQSQSGTGKTAAFVLAMLSRVDVVKNYPQVLCLSPTYELAIQTGEVAAKMSRFCPEIKIKYAVRGEEISRGSKIREHIIIGTPGKVLDWGQKFKFFDLSKISVFVLDEADVMIATQGHQDQCIRIHKLLPRTCQMMFFSATYEPEVMNFAEIIVSNPLIIRLLREEESLDNIKQYYIRCKNVDEKYTAITNIYGVITIGQAIIFCHTKKTASWLAGKMTKDGHAVAILSGDLTVEQRISVLDRFRAGLEKVLITTNVLARGKYKGGIDVEQVTIVVNFDLPMDQNRQADCETYLHRIGRTGRFGKSGIAINLIDSDYAMELCRTIEKHFGKKIHYLDAEDADEIEKIGA